MSTIPLLSYTIFTPVLSHNNDIAYDLIVYNATTSSRRAGVGYKPRKPAALHFTGKFVY
jgi:hypothetical protein